MMIFQKGKVKLEKWAVDAKENPGKKPTPMGTVIARAK